MKIPRLRVVFTTLAAVALTVAAACARTDAPTAAPSSTVEVSQQAPQNLGGLGDIVGGVLSSPNLGLFSCTTPSYGSVTKTIGRDGGIIVVGPHALAIPPGALSKPVAITATAPKGKRVQVDFAPHGLRFEKSVGLTLSYKHCLLPPLAPRIAYVDEGGRILELLQAIKISLTKSVVGKIDHFSGYALAD